MLKFCISILLLVLSTQSFSQTTIYMQKQDGIYIVPCTINGLKLKFVFDTGASDVSISATEALFMAKNGYLDPRDISGTQRYTNADGEVSVGKKLIIRKLEFGGLTLRNVEASVVNNMVAPLLLGQSAISKLGKIQIDGNKLIILNGVASVSSRSIKVTKNRGLIANSDGKDVIKPLSSKQKNNSKTCSGYLYKARLVLTDPQYRYLYSEETYTDETKRIIQLPENAELYVIEENRNENHMFYYVCYQGISGYISMHLLNKE